MSKPPASGYIAIARGIFEHHLFKERRAFSRLEAWEWLISQAAWKPAGKRRRHSVTHLERGQLAATERELADAWSWPKSNVRRFLSKMVREGLLHLRKSKGGPKTGPETGPTNSYPITVITICKYEQFQFGSTRRKAQADQKADQKADQSSPQLPGIVQDFSPEPLNPSNPRESRKRRPTKGQLDKPRHGARSKDRVWVWFDSGTIEWLRCSNAYRDVNGVEKLPENRNGGRGNWFRWLGEKRKA